MVSKQAHKSEAMLMFECATATTTATTTSAKIMSQTPQNLTTTNDDDDYANDHQSADNQSNVTTTTMPTESPTTKTSSVATKIKLSFSVDRLLSVENAGKRTIVQNIAQMMKSVEPCCESPYGCCSYTPCYLSSTQQQQHIASSASPYAMRTTYPGSSSSGIPTTDSMKLFPCAAVAQTPFGDYKSVVRPMPIRPENVNVCTPAYPTLATSALLRFHHHQQQHQQQQQHHHQQKSTRLTLTPTAMMTPLNGLKSLQLSQQNRFLNKASPHLALLDMPTALPAATPANITVSCSSVGATSAAQNGGSSGGVGSPAAATASTLVGKRKRSWSRAVFTNLQRKGLEIQFQQQKYITKPDRRKLAARLNLTDAQVKVWFQNRRMKWRHTRENLKSGHEKQPCVASAATGANEKLSDAVTATAAELVGYSTDGTSSVELSENEHEHEPDDDDDDDEIDVVE